MMKSQLILLLSYFLVFAFSQRTAARIVTPTSQMEQLDRGAVALQASKGIFVSWRLLGTDDKSATRFMLMRDGETIATDLAVTNYMDTEGTVDSRYRLVTFVNGKKSETPVDIIPWKKRCLPLKLDQPAQGSNGGTYTPNDMSVGDVDGDGQYELIVKWDPSTQQDNGYDGLTDKVFLDCYKIVTPEGTDTPQADKLWRIDLGNNIRAGAHYTQFLVYDFDGDGLAEVMCKTAPGTKDGLGMYVNQAATDATIVTHSNTANYVNSKGRILEGPEYLTVFNGLTGKAMHTTWYLPNRAGNFNQSDKYPSSSYWGDSSGNRGERFLAAVAALDGPGFHHSAVFCRGYYTRAFVWAVDFDGQQLHTKWLHHSQDKNIVVRYMGDDLEKQPNKAYTKNTGGVKAGEVSGGGGNVGSCTLYANGNHNLSVADVDGDGCDEIIWGAGALDQDGSLLYATGYGHGDALHVGKMIPDREGLQVFDVHEEGLVAKHGSWDLHDAATGEVIYHGGSEGEDNGRGMAADLSSTNRGYEFWSSDERYPKSATTGKQVIGKSCSVNFRIYWDGSCQDQLFDGSYSDGSAAPHIQKYNGSSFTDIVSFSNVNYRNAQTCNTTKSTPCLQADILGDWREELIMWNLKDPSEVNIYTTNIKTDYAVPTLMHDHTYRMAVAWQNTAYNQPPHLGFYLRDYVEGKLQEPTGITAPEIFPAGKDRSDSDGCQREERFFNLQGCRTNGMRPGLNIVRSADSVKKVVL